MWGKNRQGGCPKKHLGWGVPSGNWIIDNSICNLKLENICFMKSNRCHPPTPIHPRFLLSCSILKFWFISELFLAIPYFVLRCQMQPTTCLALHIESPESFFFTFLLVLPPEVITMIFPLLDKIQWTHSPAPHPQEKSKTEKKEEKREEKEKVKMW